MSSTIDRFKEVIRDPTALKFEARKRKKDIIFWIVVLVIITSAYFILSNKDYSFLLVLSSTIQMFSFLIIVIKVYNFQSSAGLSYNSILCYAIILISRLTSTLFYNGYLPADTAGDWFYQLTEIIGLSCCLCLVYMLRVSHRDTADTEKDGVDYKYLVIPAAALALLIHPSLNRNVITDVLWTISMYLEGVAIFPQLYLFKEKKGVVEAYTSHYVALQGLSRLFSLVFWFDTFQELQEASSKGYSLFNAYVGYFVMLAQILQLLIMIDYYWHYFKSIWKRDNIDMNLI
jgi:hypothetical protein